MSTYYQQFESYQSVLHQMVIILVLVGLALGLGWLLASRLLPARLVGVGRWVYLLTVLGLALGVIYISRGA